MITATFLKTKYPYLSSQPDARLDIYIQDGLAALDPSFYGEQLERALELWVMCRLVATTPELRSTLGIRSESVSAQGRSVSVTYADDGNSGGNWFCAELERLQTALALGGWVV